MREYQRNLSRLVKAITIFLLLSGFVGCAHTQQEHVHHMSHTVMPFNMSKTMHIFNMTELGGIQRVIVKDLNDSEQIVMIQQHLKYVAEKFQNGDYSEPASLHGADMPGLKDLQAGSSEINITFSALPAGAEITFETKDLQMLTAIHRWFGAQLSEHGSDAKAE